MSLGVTPGAKRALEADAHPLRPALHQGLRRQHMRHLAGADAEGERAHAAMGAGVAVAADEESAGQAQAQLRAHDMDDALSGLAEIEEANAILAAEAAEILEEPLTHRRGAGATGRAGDGVVGGGEGEARTPHTIPLLADVGDGTAAAEIVQQVAVNMEEGVAAAQIGDDMLVPDLVEERGPHSPITSPKSTHCLP